MGVLRDLRWKGNAVVFVRLNQFISQGKEKTAYHFQYTNWKNERKVPESPGDFVQFIKDIEKCTKQRETDTVYVKYCCTLLVSSKNTYRTPE